MKYKVFKVIFAILIIIMFILATVFLIRGLTMEEDKDSKNPSIPSVSKVDVNKIISDIKNENGEPYYESDKIDEFTCLTFLKDNRMQSYMIDSYTGEELTLEDILKEGSLKDFENKELELLKLKYPEFIVEGIQNSEGVKVYVIKDQEMVIYYYDYTYNYEYQDVVSLTINYNEIHDYLDFTHVLDENYENENGYQYSKDKSGNEVASHTYNHMNMKKNSILDVNENIKKTDDLYYQITGDHIKYVRPPYGAYSKTNLENVDYPLILWNLDTEDWRYRDVDHIVNYVMDNVSDGSIILMHELYQTSVEALEILLPKLYAAGYQVVSISELATLQGKTLEAGHAYRAIMN